MNDFVSVVVAVYNAENDLDHCITSICSQSYKNLQIILVDDGSTDQSPQICDKWEKKDSRIVTKHLENGGVSRARNEGIQCAEGTYIAFVDSDDWLEKDFIRTLVQNHTDGSMTCCGYMVERMERRGNVKCRRVTYSSKEKDILPRREVLSLYTSALFSVVWNKLYETSLLRENNIVFPTGYSLGEDFMFNLQYLGVLHGDIVVVNTPCYHYIIRNNQSLSQRYYEDFYEIQSTIFERFLSYLKQVKASEDQLQLARQLYFNALIVSFDNLYRNRKYMEKTAYLTAYGELVHRREFANLVSAMRGCRKMISFIRWQLICHKLFMIEYYFRELIKKLLRLE